jgi:hypothetical protein
MLRRKFAAAFLLSAFITPTFVFAQQPATGAGDAGGEQRCGD